MHATELLHICTTIANAGHFSSRPAWRLHCFCVCVCLHSNTNPIHSCILCRWWWSFVYRSRSVSKVSDESLAAVTAQPSSSSSASSTETSNVSIRNAIILAIIIYEAIIYACRHRLIHNQACNHRGSFASHHHSNRWSGVRLKCGEWSIFFLFLLYEIKQSQQHVDI